MKIKKISNTIAICGLIGSANVALALENSNPLTIVSEFQEDGTTWMTADAADMASLLGDSFSIYTTDNYAMDLKLIETIAGKPDANRPTSLARRQSVIAVFQASKSDREWLARSGAKIADCWHHKLGSTRVYISAIPKRDGDYSVEFVLN